MKMKQASKKSLLEFDFLEPAELFYAGSAAGNTKPVSYRRFKTSTEAVRYVIEELSIAAQRTCILQVNDSRFNQLDLMALYNSGRISLRTSLRADSAACSDTPQQECNAVETELDDADDR